jgi:hypothetical protein
VIGVASSIVPFCDFVGGEKSLNATNMNTPQMAYDLAMIRKYARKSKLVDKGR